VVNSFQKIIKNFGLDGLYKNSVGNRKWSQSLNLKTFLLAPGNILRLTIALFISSQCLFLFARI